MAKSIKLKNDTYLDSTSIVHNKTKLSDLLNKKILNTFTVNVGTLSSGATKDISSHFPISDLSSDKLILAYYWSNSELSWRGITIFNNLAYEYPSLKNVIEIEKRGNTIRLKNSHNTSLDFGTVTVKWFYL